MSATLRADSRTSPFGLGSCSHMHSAPPQNDFCRTFWRNARRGRERIEKRSAKNCGAKSNSHEFLRIHTTYPAGEEIKNHHTLPVKSTCRSFSHRRSKEFCKQPTIPPGFRRKTQRMFPVMTMFPCGDLDVLLGVECWSEACRRRESRATFGEEPSGVAANLWLLRRSTPLQHAPPPGSRSSDGTRRRGDARTWRESSTVYRPRRARPRAYGEDLS